MALCVAYDSGVALCLNFLTNLTSCSYYVWLNHAGALSLFQFLLQNDLVHGWGLDFALRRCVEVRLCSYLNYLIKYIVQCNQTLKSFMIYYVGLDWFVHLLVQPAHEKIGVVDSEWIVHQVIPSLGNQVSHHSQPREKTSNTIAFHLKFNFTIIT